MNAGFHISKLQINGDGVVPSQIVFTSGLNVITGPSDTGKSYVYQCIDYMLGGEQAPKRIEESSGYSTIYLEITTSDRKIYTLIRALRGGEINLFDGTIEEFGRSDNESSDLVTLKATHIADNPANISTFLLSLSGIEENIKIRKNKRFELINLTFRTIYHLFLVDEERIIEDKSPIYGKSGYSNTPSKWAFHYLLTGEDDNSLVSLSDPKIIKAKEDERRLVFDELIGNLEETIQLLGGNDNEITEELNNLEGRISEQVNAVSMSSDNVASSMQQRQSHWNQQQEADSRIIAIDQLLLRFSLLKNHYETDLERLEFMSEGDHYFQQLETINCPLCGTPLEDHESRQRCIDNNGEMIDLQTAAKQEAQKISLHLRDLEQTFEALENERNTLVVSSVRSKSEVDEIDRILGEILRPRLATEKSVLDQLLIEQRRFDELRINTERLKELWVLRANVTSSPSQQKPEQDANMNLDGKALSNLSEKIELLLRTWQFPEAGRVQFDEKVMDIAINGKPRKSHGKGVRALIRSAFNIGLMRFSIDTNRPHPRLVVLDSPLLNFKQRISEEDDEISGDVKRAFFTDLANTPDSEQIIIFENEPVPNELKHAINVIEFVGPSHDGRHGFYI